MFHLLAWNFLDEPLETAGNYFNLLWLPELPDVPALFNPFKF
jgi:hypothetical protein